MKLSSRQGYSSLSKMASAAIAILILPSASRAEEITVSALARRTHFHGIAVSHRDPSRLYLATHHGFYVVTPDGKASRASQRSDDYMGFTPHPTDNNSLYASGHSADAGNLGVMSSIDDGRSWTKLSDGAGGPVDFHQMDVSKADTKVIYGVYGDLQRSADGGHTWSRLGPAPEGLIGLAASAKSAETVYAATQRGLQVSKNGGLHWIPAHASRHAATMVRTTTEATIYAFIAGIGLVRATEPDLDWRVVSNGFGREIVLHLAVSSPGTHMYAVTFDPDTRLQSLRKSRDGGRSWLFLG